MLIEAGASTDIPDTQFGKPLFAAAKWGDAVLAEMLIAEGAKLDAVNEYGETALHQAIMSRSRAVAEVLIAHGADVNARSREGRTPLYFAENANPPAPELVQLLKDAGAQDMKRSRREKQGAAQGQP
jgi:ankyrin repeat protein